MRTSVCLVLALSACTPEMVDEPLLDGSADPIEAYDPLALVDPFIATAGDGAEIANVNPGASVPLGMTLVGPDTRLDFGSVPFYHCGGYWYDDTFVRGFSHTHAHGMGVPDYGTLSFMPRDGWEDAYTGEKARMAPFNHEEEWASAGRYGVVLQDHDISVDITATQRGGHSIVTFPAGADPVVVWDLGQAIPSGTVNDAVADWAPDDATMTIFQQSSGSYSGRFGGLMQYAHVVFDPAPIGGGGWTDPASPEAGLQHVEGDTAGVWLRFPEGTTEVGIRLALSYVDADGAQANFDAELAEGTFEDHLAQSEDAWRAYLTRARVRGGTDEERVIFHTALFHALLFPSRQDDVDGRYRGVDQNIHTADGPHYSDLSMWDTFRTIHPWYTLVWPELQRDVNRSIVRMVQDGGWLPKWPLAHGYTGGMVGTPAIQILAGSWLKGIRDFDVDTAYEASLASATTQVGRNARDGLAEYQTLGFVPTESSGGSVSDTLEYAWNDHALALWGEALGRPEAEVDAVRQQSKGWQGVWNADAGFNTGRQRDGTFVWEGDPISWEGYFVEGNAWHYVWYVPYDVPGMIALQHGGDVDAFTERFTTYWDNVYAEEDDIGADDYYWHGNEPVMHVAFLGSLIDRPDLTADPSRWVMANRYAHDPVGLDGNDDAGTLSAWFLLSSVGLFPVAGTTEYAWSSPLFERVELEPEPGRQLVIRAPGVSEDVRYLQRWQVGDTELTSSILDHDTLWSGGDLLMTLSEDPAAWAP